MSYVRLLILDAQRELGGCRHGSFAERVIAALSAEPETIEELDAALERFIERSQESYFCDFSSDANDEPYDAGLVIIDLAARLVICDSTYCSAEPEGSVTYDDGTGTPDLFLNYHLSDDWLLSQDATEWRELADERRRHRSDHPPFDARAVLYGDVLLAFIAEQCWEVFRDPGPAPKKDYEDPAYQREDDQIKEIHVRWMMTARDNLRGQTPRQVLISRRRFAEDSVQDREFQWSRTDKCPPGLDPESAAYRFAGFGIHETVVYYDLVRELLRLCSDDVAECQVVGDVPERGQEEFVAAELPALARLRDEWLDAPYSDCGERTARSIIHNERARIPEGGSGLEPMIDPDCPLCQMQAELPGPMFWHLDGSHLDNDVAFSIYHETLEEWEDEQRKWEEFNRRFEAKQAENKRLAVNYPGAGYADPDAVWKMSFSACYSADAPLPMRLFAVGSHLSELIVDLKEPAESLSSEQPAALPGLSELEDRLRLAFGNLRDAVQADEPVKAEAEIRLVRAEFCDALEAVRHARPDLALKCVDLRDRLQRFLEPPSGAAEAFDLFDDDDLPC